MEEMSRGTNKSVFHGKSVKGAVGNTRIDKQLKDLADLTRSANHQNLDIDSLITHDRLVSANERQQEEEELAHLMEGRSDAQSEHDRMNTTNRSVYKSKVFEDARTKIRRYIEGTLLEVVVMVEGLEAQSACTFQARHSYTLDDIVFDMWFEKCIVKDPKTGEITVDLNSFHALTPSSEGVAVQSVL
jgi:hypothetical protein